MGILLRTGAGRVYSIHLETINTRLLRTRPIAEQRTDTKPFVSSILS